MKHVLGFDNGYGDNKIVFGSVKSIDKIYKFNSVLAKIELNSNINDKRVLEYKGSHYYVGDLALSVESSRIIDLLNYSNLEKYAPLMIKKAIEEVGEIPHTIVCGLSIAHIENSGHFKQAISDYLIGDQKLGISKIDIIPQGIGGKLTYDRYGTQFPSESKELVEKSNYIGCDIGFNTLDVFQVIDGKTSPNLIRGLENQGIIKIVTRLLLAIQQKYDRTFTVKEGKQILDNGYFKIRGNEYPMSSSIDEIKKEYLSEIKTIIEDNFGRVMDKVDMIRMFGGGSYVFKSLNDPFIEIPETRAEYYNSIGQYLYGVDLANRE